MWILPRIALSVIFPKQVECFLVPQFHIYTTLTSTLIYQHTKLQGRTDENDQSLLYWYVVSCMTAIVTFTDCKDSDMNRFLPELQHHVCDVGCDIGMSRTPTCLSSMNQQEVQSRAEVFVFCFELMKSSVLSWLPQESFIPDSILT